MSQILNDLTKIEVEIPKTTYAPGETITGTITLLLDKPTKSKGVFVELTSTETKTGRNSKGQSTTMNYTQMWSRAPLDVEKEYPAGQLMTYQFSLQAPSRGAPFNPIGGLWRSITKDSSPPSKDYKVEGKLDISMGFDVNTSREIKINYA